MPAAMKTMWASASAARISSPASSAAASPTSGSEPAPSPSVRLTPSWMRNSALDEASACMSVLATTNFTLASPAAIMLFTTLQPAPPTPMTVMRGFILPVLAMGLSKGVSRRLPAGHQLAAATREFLHEPLNRYGEGAVAGGEADLALVV